MNVFTHEHTEDCKNLCVRMLPGHCCRNTKLAVQQQELHLECNNELLEVLVEELVIPDCKLQFKNRSVSQNVDQKLAGTCACKLNEFLPFPEFVSSEKSYKYCDPKRSLNNPNYPLQPLQPSSLQPLANAKKVYIYIYLHNPVNIQCVVFKQR